MLQGATENKGRIRGLTKILLSYLYEDGERPLAGDV